GGLDNLLSHHKKAANARLWGGRVLSTSAVLGLALVWPDYATPLAIFAATISFAGVAVEVLRGGGYFLDKRIRGPAPGEGAPPPSPPDIVGRHEWSRRAGRSPYRSPRARPVRPRRRLARRARCDQASAEDDPARGSRSRAVAPPARRRVHDLLGDGRPARSR